MSLFQASGRLAVGVILVAGAMSATPAQADVGEAVDGSFTSGTLDSGLDHACAVLPGRSVRCWGYGFNGQLGQNGTGDIGATAGSMAAAGNVSVPSPTTLAAVSTGGTATCALRTTRRVVCWGGREFRGPGPGPPRAQRG